LPPVYRVEGTGPTRKQLNFFKTEDQIVEATQNSQGRVFVLEVGSGPQGGISHMAIYLGGKNGGVYECTTNQPNSACIDRKLSEFLAHKQGKIFYLFGPR
jgi:hypothetical protein